MALQIFSSRRPYNVVLRHNTALHFLKLISQAAMPNLQITLPYRKLPRVYQQEVDLLRTLQSVQRHELETRLSHKPWKQEIAKITDWPRRKAVAEFGLFVGHVCLGTRLHCIGIHPDTDCMLYSLSEFIDRKDLDQCTALINGTECERYWDSRIKMMVNRLYFSS